MIMATDTASALALAPEATPAPAQLHRPFNDARPLTALVFAGYYAPNFYAVRRTGQEARDDNRHAATSLVPRPVQCRRH